MANVQPCIYKQEKTPCLNKLLGKRMINLKKLLWDAPKYHYDATLTVAMQKDVDHYETELPLFILIDEIIKSPANI